MIFKADFMIFDGLGAMDAGTFAINFSGFGESVAIAIVAASSSTQYSSSTSSALSRTCTCNGRDVKEVVEEETPQQATWTSKDLASVLGRPFTL